MEEEERCAGRCPSTNVVSEANLKKTPALLLVRWKTVAHRDNSASRKLVEVNDYMDAGPGTLTEEHFNRG